MKHPLISLVFGMLFPFAANAVTNVLVEAESFSTPGGWKVDEQFVEVMGSPFLIAHGMGTPVANATTTVAFPETGDYYVWIRTRNWVPAFSGSAAPGRFKVEVNGTQLSPEFGTVNGAWHWQAGGTIAITEGTATIMLQDVTGFDGRCDAMAFIKGSDQPPPDSGPALAEWRRMVLNEPLTPPSTQAFDCVIVGGGMAGCCAAVAAARSGVKVALVQDRPVVGGNASQEIRVATRGETRHAIVQELDSTDLANRDDRTVARDASRLAVLQAEPNITLLLSCRAYGVGTNASGRITHVDARHTQTGERRRLQAPLFIDCTGDGWIGYWAGADCRMGREARTEFNETLAPVTADAKTMGNSLMWTSRNTGTPISFPSVPWALGVAGSRAATKGDWNWEYGMSLNTIADAEAIRDHLLRAIFGSFYNAKQNATNANLALDWVPYIAGKRESRRLLGDHILTQSDLVNGVYFEDAIATTDWGIDLHYETAVSYLSSFSKTAITKCYFPFRSLYSRNVPNLMMAGRCFSSTHIGLGSPRVQNTTGQMGVAVGYAAAICNQYGIEPRDVYRIMDRTVELQARITGAWPQRPPPINGQILDNTNAVPNVCLVGDWTASTSGAGYYATNYLHDGHSGQGTKRVAYTPSMLPPGRYTIALRWAEGSNRASNTPIWICTAPQTATLDAPETVYIRNTQPNTTFMTGEMLVGRMAGSDYMRGLLQFDLSTLPATAVIVSAELQLEISARDDASSAYVGAEGLRVYRVTQPFIPAETTWNRRTAATAWATAGGDFIATPLSTIANPTSPDLAEAGHVFVFPRTAALTAAVGTARDQGTNLKLLVRTPSLETSYATRKLYRFGAAALTVHYFLPQLPATYCVDQRVRGGQWVTLGSHDVSSADLTVIIGNDGADGYVVADAVQFLQSTISATDYDGDGLPDTWERYYFLSETAADPDEDSDFDGCSNYVEHMTGTDPWDPHSRFDMRMEIDNTPGSFVLRWPSTTNRTYRIEVSSDLKSFSLLLAGIPATPPQNAERITPSGTRQFYRIVLEP